MSEPVRPGAEQGGDDAAAEPGSGVAGLGVRGAAGAAQPPTALRQLRIQQEARQGGQQYHQPSAVTTRYKIGTLVRKVSNLQVWLAKILQPPLSRGLLRIL